LSATGVFARSSRIQLPSILLIGGASTLSIRRDIPIPFPLQQTCKCGVPIAQEDTELEPNRKRQQTQTTNIDIYNMIISVIKDQQARCCNNIELAIQLLENEYQEQFSTTDFINTLEVLENSSIASFLLF
jgi:hypothetical protein